MESRAQPHRLIGVSTALPVFLHEFCTLYSNSLWEFVSYIALPPGLLSHSRGYEYVCHWVVVYNQQIVYYTFGFVESHHYVDHLNCLLLFNQGAMNNNHSKFKPNP